MVDPLVVGQHKDNQVLFILASIDVWSRKLPGGPDGLKD
jgi:hypothetical protein